VKVVSVVGARPQFIKAAPVSRELRWQHIEVLVHTGQHYNDEMSAVFFRELGIREPNYGLDVGSGSHGWQTGQMLARVEEVLLAERPDWVLVYGDTNSTLAGALAAVKLHILVAHVEAGLRSFNREMPEEHNRVLTDHCADLLFCPTRTAVDNLAKEGITRGVHLVGDVMYDAALQFGALARERSTILNDLGLLPKRYLLATVHRPYNTDDPDRLQSILEAFIEIGEPIVFPVHPRTRRCMAEFGLDSLPAFRCSNVQLVEPVGYLDMLMLEQHARLILTDSGGVQKEAYFFAVPCVTLRPETEWVETVDAGWNVVVDTDQERIVWAADGRVWPDGTPPLVFGDGCASEKMVRLLEEYLYTL
jgi:UDP-N-acetylglucosamine 2-epimerase